MSTTQYAPTIDTRPRDYQQYRYVQLNATEPRRQRPRHSRKATREARHAASGVWVALALLGFIAAWWSGLFFPDPAGDVGAVLLTVLSVGKLVWARRLWAP